MELRFERLVAGGIVFFFVVVDLRAVAVCFCFVGEGCAVEDAGDSADCAPAHADTNAHDAAKKIRLRMYPATLINYRRKLLPMRETSSSARLRMSSCEK
jgi:hypothetical protein